MCSFIGTNKKIRSLEYVNHFNQFRGPDLTNSVEHGPFTLVHNLLSITGAMTPQPFVDGAVAVVFNGEIYNYRAFGDYQSDGQALLPLYQEHGLSFIEKLDGEFALFLMDLEKERAVVSTDVFGTKPLWVGVSERGEFGVASYKSTLVRLGFKRTRQIPANTTEVYNSTTGELIETRSVHTFDLEQTVDSFEPWLQAFQESIRKRTEGLNKKVFIGLSSGYDSGAIDAELLRQKRDFKVFSIKGRENTSILENRLSLHTNKEYFSLSHPEYVAAKRHLVRRAEDVYLTINERKGQGHYVPDNNGAVGLAAICKRATDDGYKVLLSGQGADEIFSDYGFAGKKFASHSSFGGLFPKDLSTVFPWENFYSGTQRAYLDKEEVVAGSYGVETRYPFLDTAVVQAFLSLTPELKNSSYKAPLQTYLKKHGYPYDDAQKVGFEVDEYSKLQKLSPQGIALRAEWALRRALK